jgi:hypothetical protein
MAYEGSRLIWCMTHILGLHRSAVSMPCMSDMFMAYMQHSTSEEINSWSAAKKAPVLLDPEI